MAAYIVVAVFSVGRLRPPTAAVGYIPMLRLHMYAERHSLGPRLQYRVLRQARSAYAVAAGSLCRTAESRSRTAPPASRTTQAPPSVHGETGHATLPTACLMPGGARTRNPFPQVLRPSRAAATVPFGSSPSSE